MSSDPTYVRVSFPLHVTAGVHRCVQHDHQYFTEVAHRQDAHNESSEHGRFFNIVTDLVGGLLFPREKSGSIESRDQRAFLVQLSLRIHRLRSRQHVTIDELTIRTVCLCSRADTSAHATDDLDPYGNSMRYFVQITIAPL
jgi:hypothetical protein